MLFLDKVRIIIIIVAIMLLIIVYIYDFIFICTLGAVYNRRIIRTRRCVDTPEYSIGTKIKFFCKYLMYLAGCKIIQGVPRVRLGWPSLF